MGGPDLSACQWWRRGARAWCARFGLAELCGSLAAATGFGVGYAVSGSLIAASAGATAAEIAGFYGCTGARVGLNALSATRHLHGLPRAAAATLHAIRAQLASCAVAEALDDLAVRPQAIYWLTWWARHLPGGLVWGFAAGKAVADIAYYAAEAATRHGLRPSTLRDRWRWPQVLPIAAKGRHHARGYARSAT